MKRIGIPIFHAKGTKVCVLDPVMGKLPPHVSAANWGADWVTNNVEQYMQAFDASHHCAWVVDECGIWSERYRDIMAISQIAKTGGNFSNLGVFMAQRLLMIPPNIRKLCECAVLFRQSREDLEDLALLLDDPAVMEAATLDQGEFVVIEPFKPARRGRLFTMDEKKRTITFHYGKDKGIALPILE